MSPKRIVLCLDGTWNSPYDEQMYEDGKTVLKPSNVLKLARAVLPRDAGGREQLVYYDLGVGSLAKYPGLANRLLARADKMLGGMFAAGFEGNVEDALGFLAMNYLEGDEVLIFGFSRGAATARAITRFIQWCGGLPVKADAYYLALLFREYVVTCGESKPTITKAKIVPVPVAYLGVWDTVAAVGSLVQMLRGDSNNPKRSFHVGPSPVPCVKSARQALAVDERRVDFPPEIWKCPSDQSQEMEQRWFAGVHSNVGGSYLRDGLANITLRWIIAGAPGLQLDTEFLAPYGENPEGTQYESRTRKYRVLEAIRGVRGKGVRNLTGHPASANLDLHPTVIDRKRMPEVWFNPTMKKEIRQPYRPDNVLRYLATISDLPAYLARIGSPGALPNDVMTRIDELRKEAPPLAAAGLRTP
ncbi:MAG TPA: DUF2235 domain-containing protein [Thermoanaerobaculia bacterium]|nr:DUF2235 domain-containing protein [Thermoanaerobaculia bacterium]